MKKEHITTTGNCIANGDFSTGKIGRLPDGWRFTTARASLAPVFRLARYRGRKVLLATGAGNDDCVGLLATNVTLHGGRTYRLRTRFSISREIDPQRNLLFLCCRETSTRFNNGIYQFRKMPGEDVTGEGRFLVPGKGQVTGEVRIYFRLNATGKTWIHDIHLKECEPVPPRPVTVSCVAGKGSLDQWARVLDAAAALKSDLVLLPEFMNGQMRERLRGPSAQLMAAKAKKARMYIAGGMVYHDKKHDRIYNAVLLFNRAGRNIGRYYKNHPYTPELLDLGITPGTDVPVFKTDFGTVGVMTCYDSWFTDVAELLALKGAEIIMFPSAGYYRSLLPARAADNCVRIVASTLQEAGSGCSIWDTAGRDVRAPGTDPTCFAGNDSTFTAVKERRIGRIKMLSATLDLACSPSPHNWGGPAMSAPGGRRNRREQKQLLHGEIQREINRWWVET